MCATIQLGSTTGPPHSFDLLASTGWGWQGHGISLIDFGGYLVPEGRISQFASQQHAFSLGSTLFIHVCGEEACDGRFDDPTSPMSVSWTCTHTHTHIHTCTHTCTCHQACEATWLVSPGDQHPPSLILTPRMLQGSGIVEQLRHEQTVFSFFSYCNER